MQQTMLLDAEGVTVSCVIFQAITIWCAIQLFILLFDERIITMIIMPFNNVFYLYNIFYSHISVPSYKLMHGDFREAVKFSHFSKVGDYCI
jgi:hypothetical protein